MQLELKKAPWNPRPYNEFLKDQLGRHKCTFVGIIEQHGNHYLAVYMKNKEGGRDKFYYEIKTNPPELTFNDYQAVYNEITERERQIKNGIDVDAEIPTLAEVKDVADLDMTTVETVNGNKESISEPT
jgi:hypothetical protein